MHKCYANWWKIIDARKKLIDFQGHNVIGYFRELMWLHTQKAYAVFKTQKFPEDIPEGTELPLQIYNLSKASWGKLTLDVNFDLLVFAVGAFRKAEKENAELGERMFHDILLAFSKKEGEIEQDTKDVLQLLEHNDLWDIRSYPLNYQQVRERLRYLKDRDPRWTTEKPPRGLSMDHIRLRFLTGGDWGIAEQLLQKHSPKIYKDYQPRLVARRNEINTWLIDAYANPGKTDTPLDT